jgi:hypothetical protein
MVSASVAGHTCASDDSAIGAALVLLHPAPEAPIAIVAAAIPAQSAARR